MEYYETPEDFPIIPGPDRSLGLHVSDIYGDLVHTVFNEPEFDEDDSLWAQGGFVWEEHLSIAFREYCRHNLELTKNRIIFRPGEVRLDGVIMSPDGIDINNGDMRLEEYKFSWKSARIPPYKIWKWMVQVKAYLKALELLKCCMRIFYVNGYYDYKKEFSNHPFRPVYRVAIFKFEQEELDENWEMLKNHALSKGWL